ncbi:hypothetical protein [uncultured Enterococcus sp.]|uniref:hypothetical protein n=1 Tax=uncultured Enterococcus sp. TaxID=167972 RepID=UPI002AA76667|nr:hypothetical protein [uncultured Enterococcus sp.]
MRKSFNGGLDLHENDVLHLRGISNYKAIETIQPKKVYIPVQQHIGDASEVVVEIGATVTLGQTIATSGDGLGAHIHASVSGTIVAVKPIDQGQGDKSLCVVIENDFQETVCKEKPYSMDRFTQEMIVDRVEAAGVVGLGGATFPSHVKLNPRENIHTCIFNGAECEPLLMADAALMATQGEKTI